MPNLTVKFNIGGQSFSVDLDEKEQSAYSRRSYRTFLKRAPLGALKEKIDKAKTVRELEDITRAYDLVSAVDYDDFSFPAAKALSYSLACVLYDFPYARGIMDYVGSFSSFKFLAMDLMDGKKETQIGLSEFLDKNELKTLGRILLKTALDMIGDISRGLTWAYFIDNAGLFQCVIIDEEDVKESKIASLQKDILACERSLFHPKGCKGLESVYFHELGHALDKYTGLSSGVALDKLFKSLSKEDIKKGLSEYASTSPEEFVAEAMSEHYSSISPRPLAEKVFALMKERYEFAIKKGPRI